MVLYPTWPVLLTDKDWQKKKGTIAKIVSETGLGKAMKSGESTFNHLDFNAMEAAQILPGERTIDFIEEKRKEFLKRYRDDIEPVRDTVKEIRDLAQKTAADWKKNKLIPKSATKAADDVASKADEFWMELKLNSPIMTQILEGYENLIKQAKKSEATEREKLDDAIKALTVALKKVVATPTADEWTTPRDGPHQRCRSMCNAIKAIPGLRKHYWTTWQPFGDFYAKDVTKGASDEKEQILKKVKIVGTALKEFTGGYKKYMDA